MNDSNKIDTKDEEINNHDFNSNTRLFELSLKSR